jgi:hypothetical protein
MNREEITVYKKIKYSTLTKRQKILFFTTKSLNVANSECPRYYNILNNSYCIFLVDSFGKSLLETLCALFKKETKPSIQKHSQKNLITY